MIKYYLIAFLLLSCGHHQIKSDPHEWLEEIESPKALDWVKKHNEKTAKILENDPRFLSTYDHVKKIILAKDRLPFVQLSHGYIYNFWQDDKNIRGILRQTSLNSYQLKKSRWETVLDFDQLSHKENENWVYKGKTCLPPKYERCLLSLSRGGKDASVIREFDLRTKQFIKDGFNFPEAKSRIDWMDLDNLWVATDFGADSLTESGYPKIVKILRRGQPIEMAQTIFTGKSTDMMVSAFTGFEESYPQIHIIQQTVSFFETKYYLYRSNSVTPIDVPVFADLVATHEGKLIFLLQKEWKIFSAGSLISLTVDNLSDLSLKLVMKKPNKGSIDQVISLSNSLFISTLEDVSSKLYRAQQSNSNWKLSSIDVDPFSTIYFSSPDTKANETILTSETFLKPATQFILSSIGTLKKIKSAPIRFDENKFEAKQYFIKSHDGVDVPYFLLHKKGLKFNGKNPTLLYGYGGFQVNLTPSYSAVLANTWLEKGGVYVLANIRGGGEYGPSWHQAALKTKRQTAYNDFIQIAEDLINKKITSPKHLGIMGGSNGGLLMGVMYNQRPDLWNAVVCLVPLLDMLKYDQLLAGASWVGEYGSPKIKNERLFLEKISPYHNIQSKQNYPKIFISTSTKDDRVHPGHARKMVAKLDEYNKDFLYYENIEGGHSAAANLLQRATKTAREYVFLYQQLMSQ